MVCCNGKKTRDCKGDKMKKILLLIACLLIASVAQAEDITFKWAASDPADKVVTGLILTTTTVTTTVTTATTLS